MISCKHKFTDGTRCEYCQTKLSDVLKKGDSYFSEDMIRANELEGKSITKLIAEDNIALSKVEPFIAKSDNNGGKTSYYQLPKDNNGNHIIDDADDFAEWRDMNFNQGCMLKAVWTFNTDRHSGTTAERDLNKIIHYANRELKRINNDR